MYFVPQDLSRKLERNNYPCARFPNPFGACTTHSIQMRRRLRHNMKHTNKQPVAQYMPRHGTNKFCVHDQMCTCLHVRGCVCLFVCVVLVCVMKCLRICIRARRIEFAIGIWIFVCLQHLFVRMCGGTQMNVCGLFVRKHICLFTRVPIVAWGGGKQTWTTTWKSSRCWSDKSAHVCAVVYVCTSVSPRESFCPPPEPLCICACACGGLCWFS